MFKKILVTGMLLATTTSFATQQICYDEYRDCDCSNFDYVCMSDLATAVTVLNKLRLMADPIDNPDFRADKNETARDARQRGEREVAGRVLKEVVDRTVPEPAKEVVKEIIDKAMP